MHTSYMTRRYSIHLFVGSSFVCTVHDRSLKENEDNEINGYVHEEIEKN